MLSMKNGEVSFAEGTMPYVRFGRGKKTLMMLPGLGDGLRTVKGTALPMALLYRRFAKDYTVYLFSRRQNLPQGHGTEEMARDVKLAMDVLGIEQADVIGVSMGGMIAQHLAAEYPEKVRKLVLVVTCPKANPILTESVEEWVALAERGDHGGLMKSNLQRMYSAEYCRKNSWLIPVVGTLTAPRSYERFFAQARACLTHDAWDKLQRITAKTLVIGGEKDIALGGEASRELAGQISEAELKIYPEWGHALYEEAKDFQQIVLDFLLKE